jgi:LAO/AO transport system kinase
VTDPLGAEALARRVVAREPGAVARAISLVEDRRPSAEGAIVGLLRALGRASDPLRAARIGIDPDDLGLFVRSMASGGDLGGLARAAGAAVDVLSAAYEVVLVETTGVGQSETDVEHVADTVLMVIQPGSGDVLQFLKAGIIEIPDVFAVNKADLGAIAERAAGELTAALSASHAGGAALPPVVLTSATSDRGVADLFAALDAHRAALVTSGGLRERRVRATARWARRLFLTRWGEQGLEDVGGTSALLGKLEARIRRGATAVEAVSEIRPR